MSSQYTNTWESLQHYQVPEWFKDIKFGIFIHWGVYSVPGLGCWYGHGMYNTYYSRMNSGMEGEIKWFEKHREMYGDQGSFGYKDLIPLFKGENFDPKGWMDLVEASGAKYVMPVTDFHDGFAMYDSELTPFTAVKMGPKRDVIGELKEEAKKHDIKFGVSSHLAFNPEYFPKSVHYDNWDEEYELLYGPKWDNVKYPDSFIDYWLKRTVEMIDKTEPDQLWFDFGFRRPEFNEAKRKVAAYYYNKAKEWKKEVVLTYKNDMYKEGTAVLDLERGSLEDIKPMAWQIDTSVDAVDWSYCTYAKYKPVDYLIGEFIDIVSKNGCLLLNIGPKPDGTIPQEQQEILLAFGKWLQINGEAIYNTRPWVISGEGPTNMTTGHMKEKDNFGKKWCSKDIRFTQDGTHVYAIFLAYPGQGNIKIDAIHPYTFMDKTVKKVILLGHGEVPFTMDKFGFHVDMPETPPCDLAVSLKLIIG